MKVMKKPQPDSAEPVKLPPDWPRIRFTASLTIYGAAIGAAVVLVNLLSQQAEFLEGPQRLTSGRTLLLGFSGALAGISITAPFAFWIFGSRPSFATTRAREARALLVWLALGICYGIAFFIVMGAVFLPTGSHFLDFFTGTNSIVDIYAKSLNLITGRAVTFAFVFGVRFIFTGLLGGAVFAVGAWIIDRFSNSADPTTARYGGWAAAAALSIAVIALATLAPEEALARLG